MIPQEFVWVAKTLVLPPGGLILIALIGLLLIRTLKGKLLLLIAISGFYLMSTSSISGHLMQPLETIPALSLQRIKATDAQAIVVLSAGRQERAAEYGGQDTVGAETLVRLRYAAYLARITGLPIIPSGGSPLSHGPSLSAMSAAILKQEFGVKAVVLEERSRTTWEHAEVITPLLQQQGIQRVFLVTHAWHMQRALDAFSGTPLEITPAPTAFASSHLGKLSFRDWLPSASALQKSTWAIHEYIGRIWYQLKRTYDL